VTNIKQLTKAEVGAAPHSDLIGATRNESRRLMEGWWQEMTTAEEEGKPVANVFVMGSIAEILRTFDIPMSFPEITSLQTAVRGKAAEYLTAAEDYGYSPDICGYVKVDAGLHVTGRNHPNGKLPKPSLVVAPNTCNTYIKWAEIWERMYGCPVLVLDLPGWRGTRADYATDAETFKRDCAYVEGQLRELITLCEQVSGTKFDIDRLREVMGEVNTLAVLYQEVIAENKHHPAPFDAMARRAQLHGNRERLPRQSRRQRLHGARAGRAARAGAARDGRDSGGALPPPARRHGVLLALPSLPRALPRVGRRLRPLRVHDLRGRRDRQGHPLRPRPADREPRRADPLHLPAELLQYVLLPGVAGRRSSP